MSYGDQPPQRWPQTITCKICDTRVKNPLLEQWEDGKRSGFIVVVTCKICRAAMGSRKDLMWIKRRPQVPEKSADMSKKSTPAGVNAEATFDNVSDQEVARIMAEIEADLDDEYGPREKPRKRLVLDDY